jgi:hypothetical protein
MIKCHFILNVTVDYPNLMVVRCVAPQKRVPLFKNLGSLVTGSVMLDDSLLRACFLKYHDDYEFAQTGDLDSDYTCPGTFSKKNMMRTITVIAWILLVTAMNLVMILAILLSILLMTLMTIMIMEVISIVILTHVNIVRLQMALKIGSLETVMMVMVPVRAVAIMTAVQGMRSLRIKDQVDKVFFIAFQVLNV